MYFKLQTFSVIFTKPASRLQKIPAIDESNTLLLSTTELDQAVKFCAFLFNYCLLSENQIAKPPY